MRRISTFALIVSLAVGLASLGCDRTEKPDAFSQKALQQAAQETSTAIRNLGTFYSAYTEYRDVHGKGPASWDDLKSTSPPGSPNRLAAIEALRNAGCRVTWGLDKKINAEGQPDLVLAQRGELTLYLDGSIR